MCNTLRDTDYLVMNAIWDTGFIETGKDPGVTALVIMCGTMLYEITGEAHYLDDAKKSADASFSYFVTYRDGILQFPHWEPWSNPKLLQAYLLLLPHYAKMDMYIETYAKFIDWVYKNKRTEDGYFYEYLIGDNPGRTEWIMTQNAYFESYAAIALYKKNKATP